MVCAPVAVAEESMLIELPERSMSSVVELY